MSEVREMTVKEMLGLLEWHEQMVRKVFQVRWPAHLSLQNVGVF